MNSRITPPGGDGNGGAPQRPPSSGATEATNGRAGLQPAMPGQPISANVAMALAASSARALGKTGNASPPLSGRPMDEFGAPLMEQKRITPRSPRAALEPEQVAVPTRRSKRARNPLVMIGNAVFTLLILVILAGGVAFAVGKHRFEAPGPLQAEKVVNISPRLGIMEIADLLRREGVIDEHPLVFLGGVVALKARTELKSGEYLFPKQASLRDVVETMVEGKVVQHAITLPEGLTSEQIVRRLLDNDILIGNIREVPHEGTLLPESYRFPRGFPRDQVIARMQTGHRRVVAETWERRSPDLPIATPEQLVILASIIEKETSKPDERTRVAAVFVNRLKQKKRLESDPTIIYGLVGGKGSLGHPITKSEKETPTRYNTYMIDGLPPGPIANPGRASIEAAANPARTKEMYFVADGSGGHVFAENYDQHLRNVAKLRQVEQDEKNTAAAPASDVAPVVRGPAAATAPPPAAAPTPPRRAGAKK